MTADAFAPAKVNLTLHVTGQRADGYHLLDSLVVFADVGDRLWFNAGARMKITVSGPFAEGVPVDDRNLVWRAAELAGWRGHIQLEKNLPHGAGIGGGSSDAAAVLRRLGGTKHALALGADVPVCLSSRPQRMRGIGEVLQDVPRLPPFEIVLVNPRVAVPTGAVFGGLQSKENPPMPEFPTGFDTVAEFCRWLAQQRNDLELPARRYAPVIDDVLDSLSRAEIARMSGSGATCFGIFETGAQEAAAQIAAANPTWWVRVARCL